MIEVRKDRYTILSDIAFDGLDEYIRNYKPQKWLSLEQSQRNIFMNHKNSSSDF